MHILRADQRARAGLLRLAVVLVIAATAFGGTVLAMTPALAAAPLDRSYTLTSLPSGPSPTAVGVDQLTHTAYFAAPGDSALTAVDTHTNTVTATIALPPGHPTDIAADASAHRVFVANAAPNNGQIDIIDTNTVTGIGTSGDTPMAVDEANQLLYTVSDNAVAVIDARTGQIVTEIWDDLYPQSVAVDASTHSAYVTDRNGFDIAGGSVTVIDTRTQQITGHIHVGDYPRGVAVNPLTHTAYVANSTNLNGAGTVSAINTLTNTVTATVPVGNFPLSVAVDEGTNTVYVPNFGETVVTGGPPISTVSVIDGATNQIAGTVVVGRGPQAIAVDNTTHAAYVPNSQSDPGTVSVIDAHGDRAVTATTLAIPGPVVVGAPTTLTATITPATATGTVTFAEGGRPLTGSCATPAPVVKGTATCTTPFPNTLFYNVEAVYSGDTTHAPSPAWYPLIVVNPLTTTTLGVTPSTAVGVPVALTVTVTPPPDYDTSIYLADGPKISPDCSYIPIRPSVSASGSCVITFTTPGTHVLTAHFPGGNNQSSSQTTLTITVDPTPNLFQTIVGYLVQLAQHFHLFGL